MLRLAILSLHNRMGTALLTIFTIAVSVALLLGVQMTRTSARDGFENTLSGTDLVVGARTGPVNLMLLSVFRIGNAGAEVSWETYRKIASHPDVAWTIPISLGDAHRGYRILGTSADYFAHYRYNDSRALEFAAGGEFADLYDAVVGAEVARQLGYLLGDSITLSHGTGHVSFVDHADKPFRVVGILKTTGTPVDRTVHVSLEAISAIHADWQGGSPPPRSARMDAEQVREHDLTPDGITAFLIGMKSRPMALTMQRAINNYREEALTAILPGVTLAELWKLVGVADRALLAVSGMVVVAGLLGLMTSLMASLHERRREMALLRSVGARPRQVLWLLVAESGLLAFAGTLVGVGLAYLLLLMAEPLISERLGIAVGIRPPTGAELGILVGVVLAGCLAGMVPALRAYRNTLGDGLQLRT